MSIQTEINRLNAAKETLTDWMDEQEISYEEGANLTSIAETISNINIPNVLNAYSDSQTDTYSCNYVNTHLVDLFYPVGSIYISVNSTNPETLFGGKWEAFSRGRTLIGVGANEANTTDYWGSYPANSDSWHNVEERGGATKHTLTTNEMPSHKHNVGAGDGSEAIVDTTINYNSSSSHTHGDNAGKIAEAPKGGSNGSWHLRTYYTGGSQAHNNMQPYITVYMWKRTE